MFKNNTFNFVVEVFNLFSVTQIQVVGPKEFDQFAVSETAAVMWGSAVMFRAGR